MALNLFKLSLPNTSIEDIEENISEIVFEYIERLLDFEDDANSTYATQFCYEENIESDISEEYSNYIPWKVEDIMYNHEDYKLFFQEFGKEYLKWLKYELEYKIENFINEIKKNMNENNKLILYRGMSVSNTFINELKTDKRDLGECWTLSKDVTTEFSYVSKKGEQDKLLILAEIDINDIDFLTTILLHLSPSLEEKEIRVLPHGKIKLKEIEINDNKIEINDKLKEKTFIGNEDNFLLNDFKFSLVEYEKEEKDIFKICENLNHYLKIYTVEDIKEVVLCLEEHKNDLPVLEKKLLNIDFC